MPKLRESPRSFSCAKMRNADLGRLHAKPRFYAPRTYVNRAKSSYLKLQLICGIVHRDLSSQVPEATQHRESARRRLILE
jgi:hypothetical protein